MSRVSGLLSAVIVFVLPLHAQPDPDELLQRAIAKVRDTVGRLPNYLCTQTIDRSQSWIHAGGCDWWPATDRFRPNVSDRLRVDVLSTSSGEMYSWAGENRFHNQDLLRLVRLGDLSSGGFSGLLGSIFGGNNEFSYRGEVTENGRKWREYAFRVPRERSEYWFGSGSDRRVVACEGTFLIDPQTADLVRLAVRSSEPPQVSGACQAITTLNYGRARLNESEFLLPMNSVFEFAGTRGKEVRTSSVYSDCHEFRGESTVRFDAPQPGESSSAMALDRPRLQLPEGLPFRIAFTQDIYLRTAAAGDTISAKLTTPIRDAGGQTLVPSGTVVVARILIADHMRVRPQLSGGTVGVAFLLVRLESLTIEGTARPIVATTAQPFDTNDPNDYDPNGSLMVSGFARNPDEGPLVFAPNTAAFKFYRVPANFVLKAGKQSKWRTGGTGPTVKCFTGKGHC